MFNNGELPKYHAQYSHEGIVSVEEFRLVQEEFIRRDSLFNKKEQSRISPFTRKLLGISVDPITEESPLRISLCGSVEILR